ncbi:MAG: hypothetical protein JWR80_8808 [Bradyrhizobium sp.]|nr:hypothetical protein [Bradyrhizobium sp.]
MKPWWRSMTAWFLSPKIGTAISTPLTFISLVSLRLRRPCLIVQRAAASFCRRFAGEHLQRQTRQHHLSRMRREAADAHASSGDLARPGACNISQQIGTARQLSAGCTGLCRGPRRTCQENRSRGKVARQGYAAGSQQALNPRRRGARLQFLKRNVEFDTSGAPRWQRGRLSFARITVVLVHRAR